MKKRPMIVTILSAFYILAPVWILLELQFLFHVNILGNEEWFYYVSYHIAFMTLITMLAAYGMYKVRIWGYYLVLLHSLIVIVSNSILLMKGISLTNIYVGISFNLVMLAIFVIFLRKEIYSPYFNPRLRWWEQAKRFVTSDLKLKLYNGKRSMGDFGVFDISESGVFVLVPDKLDRIKMEKDYNLTINLGEPVTVLARPMWVNKSKKSTNIPLGIGFKFLNIESAGKKEIKRYVKMHSLKQRQR